jgi:hypothetical protein
MPRFYFPRVWSFIRKEFKYQNVLDREALNMRRFERDATKNSRQIASSKVFGNDLTGQSNTAG